MPVDTDLCLSLRRNRDTTLPLPQAGVSPLLDLKGGGGEQHSLVGDGVGGTN